MLDEAGLSMSRRVLRERADDGMFYSRLSLFLGDIRLQCFARMRVLDSSPKACAFKQRDEKA
jgi:hypothetical protein